MKNKWLLPIALLTLAGFIVIGATDIYAQNPTGFYPSIVQKLAQKFGLKESDIQSVFDEARNERRSQMLTKFEDRLNKAVKDGKLIEVQKQAILSKHKELQDLKLSNLQNWKNMTPDQRRAEMQKQKQDLQDWAKQNGIDLSYLFGGFGRGMKGMRGGWHLK